MTFFTFYDESTFQHTLGLILLQLAKSILFLVLQEERHGLGGKGKAVTVNKPSVKIKHKTA